MQKNIAQQYSVIRKGEFPLYDLRLRIVDRDLPGPEIFNDNLGELNSPAVFRHVQWHLRPDMYYVASFNARNGAWYQHLILKRSQRHECWLAATIVKDRKNRDVVFTSIDNGFTDEFGEPQWRP